MTPSENGLGMLPPVGLPLRIKRRVGARVVEELGVEASRDLITVQRECEKAGVKPVPTNEALYQIRHRLWGKAAAGLKVAASAAPSQTAPFATPDAAGGMMVITLRVDKAVLMSWDRDRLRDFFDGMYQIKTAVGAEGSWIEEMP